MSGLEHTGTESNLDLGSQNGRLRKVGGKDGGGRSPDLSPRGGASPGTRRRGRPRRYRGSFGLGLGAKESARHVKFTGVPREAMRG